MPRNIDTVAAYCAEDQNLVIQITGVTSDEADTIAAILKPLVKDAIAAGTGHPIVFDDVSPRKQ